MLLINAVNAEGRPVELYVKDGKIAAVGQDLTALAGENETVLDAGGLTVLPAFVDLHCHWRTPGFEYKEDIETGSRAAFDCMRVAALPLSELLPQAVTPGGVLVVISGLDYESLRLTPQSQIRKL